MRAIKVGGIPVEENAAARKALQRFFAGKAKQVGQGKQVE
jgi:hypothetical protein